ncbi:MAG: hypothetical protein KAV87_58195 [Desulfobacteraceae bacterium]|nr:hypothetical protein [Desulfobacteraceae bacterium]
MEEEQIRSIVKKVLDEEHLHDFIKIFEKEHNIFRGSHDKIQLPENLEIPEKIIKYIVESKYIYEKIIQVGAFEFIDNFGDASIFWAWQQFKGELDLAQKTIQEAGGKMLLSVNASYRAYWDNNYVEAPKVFVGILTYPCEIITRLDETTSPINNETLAGLFISKSPLGYGPILHYSIGRVRKDSVSLDGLAVMKNSYNILNSNAITTLPVWLRIRVGNDSMNASHFYFDYSLDGINWVNMWELTGDHPNSFSFAPASVGPYVVNGINLTDGGSTNGIYGKFDFFKMKLKSIN